ncbi:MAG: penicillin-binding protein 2 [Methylococcales bacterium]|nr:penicillin-binding protein 2 [Methylococcales bacterium]MBT3507186.1 penicillin-binding protein 2 [Methylococcales bacterium]MBT4600233.1 penicillin-binding protein 2 [Methylococcales bacterium]MBT4664009.1 penicillin-binding protein 2 [Methylococcales bacterium]MBT7108221.1 penicillin-binding protein 2 [Methylococcales bacterium]
MISSYQKTERLTGSTQRRQILCGVMFCGMLILLGKAISLQVLEKDFLKHQGDIRHIVDVNVSAYRGKIVDRNGEPLAISTPVKSVWVNPKQVSDVASQHITALESLLKLPQGKFTKIIEKNTDKHFVYLKRHVSPVVAAQVKALKITGVHLDREFKRFYPSGEITGHLLGFTDIDDIGQEGLELAFEKVLRGVPGKKRVMRDGKKNVIADIEEISSPVPGRDLQISIDSRLQYLAYRELKAAVKSHQASSGSLVMLDAKTGEVLAVVNQPSFNPNDRGDLQGYRYRNRAMTDVFEPGSTVKPFLIASALDGGYVSANDVVDTSPGYYRIGRNVVRDFRNYGVLGLTDILKKSSNVAVSKIANEMPAEAMWGFYNRLGMGQSAGVGFPGEASGTLIDYQYMNDFEQATLSFGYGVSMSVIQLARAYTALADDGLLHSVTLLKRDYDQDSQRVFTPKTASNIRAMLEHVVEKDGTAYKARVAGYSVAGKTGTVKKIINGSYSNEQYLSLFVGIIPAQDPRLVMAVLIDEPTAGDYYGGAVAGPVFSKVMSRSMRILGVDPSFYQDQKKPLVLASQGYKP